jgi:hypothetical protein
VAEDWLGVGGNWAVQDEELAFGVVKQFDRLACGAACGEMLLQSRGITSVGQRAIATVTGIPVEVDQLAAGLNVFSDLSGRWLGQRVFIPGGSHRQLIIA